MYRRGNKSKIITSLVLVLVLGLSMGFAAFTNTLRISPQAAIIPDSATFDIDFSSSSSSVVADDITPSLTGTGFTAEAAVIDNSASPTISNLSVNFTEPGQKAVYSFYAYNNGEHLAYLNSINFINPEGKDSFITCEAVEEGTQYVESACNGIKVRIEVGNLETDTTKENITGHRLARATGYEVIVTIEYLEGSAVADGPFTADIGNITLVYSTVDNESETDIGSTYVGANPCTYSGELFQGAEYVNGQYTYRYMQEKSAGWQNITNDGWGVNVTEHHGKGEAITTKLCSSINNKPIVSMADMFHDKCSYCSIDLSSFDTSNVTNMSYMFDMVTTSTLDLSSFDTSNVTDMSEMFMSVDVPTLDLSSFDTSNVTSMSYMFAGNNFTVLNLSSFDTSNVTDMSGMFSSSTISTLDLLSFDTSNVTNMQNMFEAANIPILDLSSFDTSNVTFMNNMFISASATRGYAKTQADADRFNASSDKPSTLTFQVKTS